MHVFGQSKNLFRIIMPEKNQLDSWIKSTKKKKKNVLVECSVSTQKQPLSKVYVSTKIVSQYDQEIPQSQTADNPVAPRGRAAQPSQDTRKTN